jgi:hypothetical protein
VKWLAKEFDFHSRSSDSGSNAHSRRTSQNEAAC